MGYQVEKLDFVDALNEIHTYKYALVYRISDMQLLPISDDFTFDEKDCVEARFFDGNGEIHLYGESGKMQAVRVSDTDGEDELLHCYELANPFRGLGEKLYVKEYLQYDEDGQAVTALTRLVDIE